MTKTNSKTTLINTINTLNTLIAESEARQRRLREAIAKVDRDTKYLEGKTAAIEARIALRRAQR